MRITVLRNYTSVILLAWVAHNDIERVKMKIAIIGSGISGLGAAYLLNNDHDITLYEKNEYIGGHSRTIDIDIDGKKTPVDTGFIVFNYRNYPNLTGLFEHLNVPIEKSDMSFGVSIDNGWLEYGTRRPLDIFAQKSNLLKLKFWKMLADILKFNSKAKDYLQSDLSLGECLEELKVGHWFRDYYLLPMGASIWSTPTKGMLEFPARTFIRFFDNHGLLTINDQPQWHTVKGGSKEYVKRITESFKDKVILGCGADEVRRKEDCIEVTDSRGKKEKYDEVIFACHSDQVLKILQNPTSDEQSIIGSVNYQPNEMILHTDTSFMQNRKDAWSSWVYLSEEKEDKSSSVSLSYWMNNLQPLNTEKPIIVTLNPDREPDPKTIFDRHTFYHPVFDEVAVEAQSRLNNIQGIDRIWYTGAWQRYGFHEDGLLSAVNIAKKMGIRIPWK
jgi:predicted NAD/FAD-binding protein